MEENVPISSRSWQPEDEISPEAKRLGGLKGIMFRGKWLISPERQERSVKFFWVSERDNLCVQRKCLMANARLTIPFQRLLLKNAFVPLFFRLTVLAFSCAALGVSAGILKTVGSVNDDNDVNNQCAPRASTYMGIIVPSIAIPYVGYVTWDEYMSKP
jgi:hypothetical protein